MRRPSVLTLAASSAVGAAFALSSGLVDVTPTGLVGATWYGIPATWLRKLVIPSQYYPWSVDWGGLAVDLIFWIAVTIALTLVVLQLRR